MVNQAIYGLRTIDCESDDTYRAHIQRVDEPRAAAGARLSRPQLRFEALFGGAELSKEGAHCALSPPEATIQAMQNEQYPFQMKRIRRETSTDASTTAIFLDNVLASGVANNKETIDRMISTLQRLRDGDESISYISSTVDVLNSLSSVAHCCTSTSSTQEDNNRFVTATTTQASSSASSETRVPALQTVPSIFPQHKPDASPWNGDPLQGFSFPQQAHHRQMQPPFNLLLPLDYSGNAAALSNVRTPLHAYPSSFSKSASKSGAPQLATTASDASYDGATTLSDSQRRQHVRNQG
ncbi:hypothetical protein Y032_0078g1185 [Ancylostoma ceylanicum]|uniref:Uncharacterized protein n=1 Tax=Ancylostoma ceylanicum TaxID=53326 RepID=A0A016TU08_9BILA|nr:hypothetical protein Y032_0078g1185 [Ancylostoma ceylanicum]